MKLQSADATLAISVGAPGSGFILEVQRHVWVFNAAGEITADFPPEGHQSANSPQFCPLCRGFVVANYGLPSHGKEQS